MTDFLNEPTANPPPPGIGSHDIPFCVDFVYRLRFTQDVLNLVNPVLNDVLAPPENRRARSLVIIDAGVAEAWPGLANTVQKYFNAHTQTQELVEEPLIVPGGEATKNDSIVFDRVIDAIHRTGLCRQSYVIIIGGGAVLDAVGWAVATAHRGLRIVRLPTTTLAQDDAGIGVKNGLNRFGTKNFLGAFAVPWAVINDDRFLTTLSDRDWRCGWAEAVKVALLKDSEFFDQIEALAPALQRRDLYAGAFVVERCARLHLSHIVDGGDPFEMLTARPLDFGHWAAHKIEEMTEYTVRHGEAVAIGLALDVVYSAMTDLLQWPVVDRVLNCLGSLGFALYHDVLHNRATLLEGLEEFREHLGGELTITLLQGIAQPLDIHEIDHSTVGRAIDYLVEDAEGRIARFAG